MKEKEELEKKLEKLQEIALSLQSGEEYSTLNAFKTELLRRDIVETSVYRVDFDKIGQMFRVLAERKEKYKEIKSPETEFAKLQVSMLSVSYVH